MRIIRIVALSAVIAISSIFAPLAGAHDKKQSRPSWLPKIWWAIGMCETGLNWKHHTSSYQGAFGFYYGSWDAFRPKNYPSEAYNATPQQQLYVAQRIYARYGFTGWGCYTHGGYRYWL